MDSNNKKKIGCAGLAVLAVVIILLNNILFGSLFSQKVKEVDYNVFLDELENKNIDEVQVGETMIYFSLKDEKNEKTDANDAKNSFAAIINKENGKKIYTTVLMDDAMLVEKLYRAGAHFSKVQPKQLNPILELLISVVLPIVLMFFLWRFMFKQIGKGGNMMSFGKSNAKIYVKALTGKTFADVAGQDEAKDALNEIVDFLHNPQKYSDIGAKLPKGALLVGPPGTGKTLLAQAVAGEANVPFFSISGSEFVEMFVGMGAAKVRDLFKQANEKAPCIVFIDEIDTIGKRRDGNISGNDEREQTLNQLLTEMDGFDGNKGVVILAATNRPETLDKALLRPGRFDRRIPVELPDLSGREAILKVHAQKIKMNSNVDFSAIARATSGASGAELANIINEAALRAVRHKRELVTQNDLEESVEVIIAGYRRKGMVVSADEKKIIAYHEVGHALVAAKQKNTAPVHKITIIPRTSGALGYTMQVDESEHFLMKKEQAFNKLAVYTGGRAAEEIVFNEITSGASNDIEQATKLARAMVTRFGMCGEFGMVAFESVNNPYLSTDTSLTCSPETAARIDVEVIELVKRAHDTAKKILVENRQKLDEIAAFLLEKETITGEEFLNILNKETITNETVKYTEENI